MMQRRPVDSALIEIFKGSSTSRGLEEMKAQLALIQAACAIAMEGTIRATASEIAARAMTEFGMESTPSFAGQVFANLQIATVTSHGKSRFVLEKGELEEIRKGMVARCEDQIARLKESLKVFHDYHQTIEDLQNQWQEILDLRKKERELIVAINEERSKPSQLPQLQAEAIKYREQAVVAQELEKECHCLSRKVKSLPRLEEKKKLLNAAIREHEEKEKQLTVKEQKTITKERWLAAKETELASSIEKLQKRRGWIDLATLEQTIKEVKQELKQLSKQLGEKRSLVDKLFHRKGDG
ncbi:hypothetical protein ACFLXH_00910 [Chloroflexota bacterium]